ncbi:glycosyl transferase [Candidatus Methanoperedens nitroreducens]|uniref:Glycosyl transferase n=1 Tax=Candidatus Methanoperedens nitratireducens TaxID=1392998 RepID=A0A062V5V6_9EURY|nr:glycosyltransferase [Candidatus Methanoperedens nitroreducens]KCZ70790.1 glycosyl transferase [Candidatus Methanoperedens nitroreducens]MDJ1420645.1 glycosyltransferase [Candidatus Methanoperedens sp.]
MLTISIGVCVYNEEKNIRDLLNSLLNQETTKYIKEIIVVSSACSDKTNDIIEHHFLNSNPKIVLIKQEKREGKASAINLFLKYASGDILVLESGDTIPAIDTIENLTEPFKNPEVGMTGGHPIPVNDSNTFMGFTVHLLWDMHHKLALRHPKLGELVAFRRDLITEIPNDTAVDEAFVEALIREKGYELVYAPDANVYNKGPETISDFLKQRRRIFAGHLHLKKTKGYAPSSMKKLDVLKLMLQGLELTPKNIIWTLFAIILELYGRALGLYDFNIKNENPFIWDMAETTKGVVPEITKDYNPGTYLTTPIVDRIKLWSLINQQTASFSKSQIQLESSFMVDTSTSILVKPETILSKTSIESNSQQYPTKEKTQELKKQHKILMKLVPLVPLVIILGNGLPEKLFKFLYIYL